MKRKLLLLLLTLMLIPLGLVAQTTMGAAKEPAYFSVLELYANYPGQTGYRGLRMPQMTTSQRDNLNLASLTTDDKKKQALGLMIYNKTTNRIEFWNGSKWIAY